MPPTLPISPSPLDLQDYLDAANDASKRARLATVALVVGSVLVLAGLLNSLDSNWMLQRMRVMADAKSQYVQQKLGLPDNDPRLEKFRDSFFNAALRAYIDNYSIKVPFFGVTFDTNDLGLIGGLGLIIILGFLLFSLERERDNLKWSFEAARPGGKPELKRLYDLLAMRQVLTSPPPRTRGIVLEFVPKLIVVLPVAVQCAVVVHDLATYRVGRMISDTHMLTVLLAEMALLASMLFVTYSCIGAIRGIDLEWLERWKQANEN